MKTETKKIKVEKTHDGIAVTIDGDVEEVRSRCHCFYNAIKDEMPSRKLLQWEKWMNREKDEMEKIMVNFMKSCIGSKTTRRIVDAYGHDCLVVEAGAITKQQRY